METRFEELRELQVLRLGWNLFQGQMSGSIPSLAMLEELNLSKNNWSVTLLWGLLHDFKSDSFMVRLRLGRPGHGAMVECELMVCHG
jgi:hypothetical protein